MKWLDELHGMLRRRHTGIPLIADWHVYVQEKAVTDVGFRRGCLGGPYAPPSIRHHVEAQVFVKWSDGKATRSMLNRAQFRQVDALPHALYAAAYPEPCPDYIPGPFVPADLQVRDVLVEEAVKGDPSPFFAPVKHLAEGLGDIADDEVHGGLSAAFVHRHLLTSRGAEADYASTVVSLSVDLGSRAFVNRDIRGIPDDNVLDYMLTRVRTDYEYLDRPYSGDVRSYPVLLSAPLTERFLGWFLLRNLSMQAIYEGSSSFTRDQLEAGAQVFHPSLNIVDKPNRDDHPSAFCFCARGQAPYARPLISEGRLSGADVSLRAAARAGVEPSPTSIPRNWLFGHVQQPYGEETPERIERLLQGVERGIFIYAVLGLHTQDPTRGAYSLGVPRAIVIHDGRVQGYVRGTLIGNFFEDLRLEPVVIPDPLHDGVILPVAARFRTA